MVFAEDRISRMLTTDFDVFFVLAVIIIFTRTYVVEYQERKFGRPYGVNHTDDETRQAFCLSREIVSNCHHNCYFVRFILLV